MRASRGLGLGLATVLLFGLTVVLQGALVREGVAPFAAVGVRYLCSGLVCLAAAVVWGRTALPVQGERGSAVLLGAVVYGLQAVLFYTALGHGTVASVALLFYTYPVLVLLAALALRRQRWSWVAGVSAGLSACGAALVVASGQRVALDATGVVLSLASACCVAAFLHANLRLLPRSPALVSSAWVSFGVALSTLALAGARGELTAFPLRAWALLATAGAATGLGTAGMLTTTAALGAGPTSVLLSLQTVVAILGSALVLGQPVVLGQLPGALLILTAIALAAAGPRRPPAVP